MDELRRAIKFDFSLRVIAAITTGVVQEACQRHGLRGVEAVALGRALTAGCLLTTLTKHPNERLRLEIRSAGPLRGLLVDARGDGSVRGCLHRHLTPDQRRRFASAAPDPAAVHMAQRQSVAAALGQPGNLSVTRDLGLEQSYQGTVDLVSGEVDGDLDHYLNTSEQLPSVLACEVIVDPHGQVLRAAGLLCQTFPDGDTTELEHLRGRLAAGQFTDLLHHDRSCSELIGFALAGEDHDDMGAKPLEFRCNCGVDRARSVVATLGAADIETLAGEQPTTEVRCEYCGMVYTLTAAQLRELADELRQGRS